MDEHLEHLSLRRRCQSFLAGTSLMSAFSNTRSAYIRFSLEFSASSFSTRFSSAMETPAYGSESIAFAGPASSPMAYLVRHLKNVAWLSACYLSRSATGTPASASFRMPTNGLSLNLDFHMTAPEPGAVATQD